jgi:hypothetical protein
MTALCACASPGPYNPSNLPTTQVSQVGELCRSVIGVRPGLELYSNCVESLSSSAARLNRTGAFQDARRACLDKGAPMAGPALAECELATANATQVSAPLPVAAPKGSDKSYFYASTRDIRRREQTACAELGYEPGSGGFSSCVASLDAALFAADHPQP